MNAVTLDRIIRKWQARLRCRDWEVEVELVPACELDRAVGTCYPTRANRQATIRIADPATQQRGLPWRQRDVESILVHELLHIVIPADRTDGSCSEEQEQGIDAIAGALVALDRRQG